MATSAKRSAKTASQTCAAGTLRRATRSVARMYDAHLAYADLTTTQFSLLRALEQHDAPIALSRLAEEQVFERTSLYRALEPLGRDGLIKLLAEPGRRAKEVELTARGRQRIAKALPHWQAAQQQFIKAFGAGAWETLSAQLIAIVHTSHAFAGE